MEGQKCLEAEYFQLPPPSPPSVELFSYDDQQELHDMRFPTIPAADLTNEGAVSFGSSVFSFQMA